MTDNTDEWGPAPEPQTWGQYLGDTANDFGRAVTNAATFGMGNRAKAVIEAAKSDLIEGKPQTYSEALENQVKASEVARERSPIASTAGDVYGSFAVPALGAERLALRTGAALANTAPRAAPAVGRAVGYGASGAVTGAAQGAGNTYTGNPEDYLENAGWGAALSAPLGAAGGAAFGRGQPVSAAKVPTAAEQELATDAAYNTLRTLPARYTPASFADRALSADQALRTAGHFTGSRDLGGSPVPFRATEQMRAPPTAVDPITGAARHINLADIDTVRKGTTGKRIAKLDPWEQEGAGIVRRAIDDFVANPPRGAVVPGTEPAARQAAMVANRARQLHAGTMRTEALDEMVRNATRTADATYSGLNLRNELQKAVRTGLKEKKGESSFSRAGYNPRELAEFERFAGGQGPVSQGLAYVDKYLGGGGGFGAALVGGLGGLALKDENADPVTSIAKGLGVSGVGLGLRLIGNRRAAADINRMRDLIAQRNPLYLERAARAGMKPGPGSSLAAKAARDAIATALIRRGAQPTAEDEWR